MQNKPFAFTRFCLSLRLEITKYAKNARTERKPDKDFVFIPVFVDWFICSERRFIYGWHGSA